MARGGGGRRAIELSGLRRDERADECKEPRASMRRQTGAREFGNGCGVFQVEEIGVNQTGLQAALVMGCRLACEAIGARLAGQVVLVANRGIRLLSAAGVDEANPPTGLHPARLAMTILVYTW